MCSAIAYLAENLSLTVKKKRLCLNMLRGFFDRTVRAYCGTALLMDRVAREPRRCPAMYATHFSAPAILTVRTRVSMIRARPHRASTGENARVSQSSWETLTRATVVRLASTSGNLAFRLAA